MVLILRPQVTASLRSNKVHEILKYSDLKLHKDSGSEPKTNQILNDIK